MLDHHVRPALDRGYARLVQQAAFIPANLITLAGFALVPVVVWAIATGQFMLGLVCLLANRFLDGLDGPVARQRGEASDFGGFADIVADFLFYASVPVAFALYSPTLNGLASALLLASFIGTGCSFLSYAILAAKRGVETTARGKKSFYHLGGLIEGTETIAFMVIICLLPMHYALLAYIFAGLCGLSTLGRVIMAYQDFR